MNSKRKLKIAIVGAGYVGLSLALLLTKSADVVLVDIDKDKLEKIAAGLSPLKDREIEEVLSVPKRRPKVSSDKSVALRNSDFVIVATPTDYDAERNEFDTLSVEEVIRESREYAPDAFVIIKSTVPIGFTDQMRSKYETNLIAFSPEFLREGRALQDNLFPSRIVVGDDSERVAIFAELLKSCAEQEDIPVFLTGSSEAEAIKLFANTYLAMRIAFFNELDTFALSRGLDTKTIIDGVCADRRIGDHYNNPSFGYGGYCLPKDTRQILSHYRDVPQNIIQAIVTSNETRMEFIAQLVSTKNPKTIGVYRLTMKAGSDNFRTSAICGIMQRLEALDFDIIVYEPALQKNKLPNFEAVNDLAAFKSQSDLILANRVDSNLIDVMHKVVSRDVFTRD